MSGFKTVGVGGTFDELHKGHKALLSKAFEVGEHVVIGLSSDKFVQKMKKKHATASYDVRLADLKHFLSQNGWLGRAEIAPIDQPFGTALTDRRIGALVVSEETALVAVNINEARKLSGLRKIEIVCIDMVLSENSLPISTTRIRRGEIDREGNLNKT